MAIIGFIYIIENTQNDKVYIGQTLYTDLNQRFHEHKVSANQPRLQNRSLYKAFIELGIEAFSIRLLESCSIELLDERECYWINYYNSYNNGYNDTMGGVSRQCYSYEAILSDFMDGLSTKEICAKYGCSDTVITSALNTYSCEHHLNGAQVNARIIVAKDKQTNEVIKRFPFLKAAGEWIQSKNNIKTASLQSIKTNINRATNPKHNRQSAYGYKWEYEEPLCNIDSQGTGIYGIKDMNERIIYIGHTRRSFASRWVEHLRKYMKLEWPLYHYIRENGVNSVAFVVIEEIDSDASIDVFIDREKYWINYYETNNRDWGLNLRVPVSTVKSHSYAEHIDKIYELLLAGAGNSEIMDNFDINASTLSLIRNGKSYYNPDIDYPIMPAANQYRQQSRKNVNNERSSLSNHDKLSDRKCNICNKTLTVRQEKYCSSECQHEAQKHSRPFRNILKQLIRSTNFSAIARKYNVTDNTVRKWCKAYNLPSTTWEIHQYSDQEWEDECWSNNDNNVPQQRAILYESIIMSLLKSRNGILTLQQFKISKGTMSTARNYYKLPYLPTIQYCSTFCYYQEGQIYFMSAKDAATWLFENQYGTNIETLRAKVAASFRLGVPATLTLPDPSTGSPVTLTFAHIPEEKFYSIIQHHHVVSYAFDPKWRAIVEAPSLLPDFISLDDLPWVEEFKKFYGMD